MRMICKARSIIHQPRRSETTVLATIKYLMDISSQVSTWTVDCSEVNFGEDVPGDVAHTSGYVLRCNDVKVWLSARHALSGRCSLSVD